jgi:hypothetical protein
MMRNNIGNPFVIRTKKNHSFVMRSIIRIPHKYIYAYIQKLSSIETTGKCQQSSTYV